MEILMADQIALDDALVAPADRLKIGKCNLRLSSDVTSKEATLQVVYDVAMGLKKQPDVAAGAPAVAEDAPAIDVGGRARDTWALTEQRGVIDAMAHDLSRFCTWTTTSLTRMMDRVGVSYSSYSQTPRGYQRRVRQRTSEASTSAAQQGLQQPDP
ncbi:hypothetical protein Tco_0641443 [Tanacetum coccineum]